MSPTHAEVARTLAAGHLPARAYIACRPGPFPVRHATDAQGRVLLLAPRDGVLAAALRPGPGADDTALVLDIADVPPLAEAPSLGRVWISGWVIRLDGDEARAAAVDYAETDASGDLLDVGDTQVLHRMEVAEIRYERDGTLTEVDPGAYAAAGPDPLRTIEFDLIADLADHHAPTITDYLHRRLGPAVGSGQPRIVRVDRYGFLVNAGGELCRLAFPRAVRDRHDLARLLHPVLCRRCAAGARP
jgi:hypothetical protein